MSKVSSLSTRSPTRSTNSSLSLIRYSPDRPNTSLIYENDTEQQGLLSKMVILKKLPEKLSEFLLIPKWTIYITSFLFFTLLTILVAAILILLCARRPGMYLEDCKQRSCAPGLNLKCINDICQCKENQYFLNKCIELKGNAEFCQSQNQCINALNCTGGKCQCGDSFYWDGEKCNQRKSYRETCSGDQCLSSSFLYCDNVNKMCLCDNIRFWDGSICVTKRFYNERCLYNNECDPTKDLTCQNSICLCRNMTLQYYDTTTLTCLSKLNETESCSSTIQCLGDMTCKNNKCLCGALKYLDFVTLICTPKTLNNTVCSETRTCREDLGLTCQSNRCQCDSTTKFWYSVNSNCTNYLTYGQTSCSDDSNCGFTSNLICNLNPVANSCTCPTTSLLTMCDCKRIYGSEYYWATTACTPAKAFGQMCLFNYECQKLTQGTSCISSFCNCTRSVGSEYYFNGASCTPALTYGSICSYSSGAQQCQVLTQSTQCIGNLCTCLRVSGNENYWTGTVCTAAKTYRSACLYNYECQYITQLTTCILNQCDCHKVYGNESYWDTTTSKCQPAKDYNQTCSIYSNCKTLTQLTSCISNVCSCSNGYFDTTAMVCKFCDSGWTYYNEKCYKGQKNALGHYSAYKTYCISLKPPSSKFADITSQAMITFVLKTLVIDHVYVGSGTGVCGGNTGSCPLLDDKPPACVYDHPCNHDDGCVCEYTL